MQHIKIQYFKFSSFLSDSFKVKPNKRNTDKEAGFKIELDRFMTNIIQYFFTSAIGSPGLVTQEHLSSPFFQP